MAKAKPARLSISGMGLAVGVYWALSMLVVGWTSMFDWGNGFVDVMSSIYIGFEPTFIGAIVGGIWGFFDGLLAGIVFSFFYNLFSK